MRSTRIPSIQRALVLFMMLCTMLTGCSKPPAKRPVLRAPTPAESIELVLKQDRLAILTEDEMKMPGTERINLIVTRMQLIDTRQCPEDFRVAYQRYIAAFIELAPYVKTSAHITSYLESFIAGFTGNPNWQQTGPGAQAALAKVISTYNDVTIIAAKYGCAANKK